MFYVGLRIYILLLDEVGLDVIISSWSMVLIELKCVLINFLPVGSVHFW